MANNETIPEREEAMVIMAEAAVAKQHEYIHGDADTDIDTESGKVPSIAKQAKINAEQTSAALLEIASQVSGALTYPTIEWGLSKTLPGGYFSTPSTEEDAFNDFYQNVDGVAVYLDSLPNKTFVKALQIATDIVVERLNKTDMRTRNVFGRRVPGIGFLAKDGKGGMAIWTDEQGNFNSISSNTLRHIVGGVEQIAQTKRRMLGTRWAAFGNDGLAIAALRNSGVIDLAMLNVQQLFISGKPIDKVGINKLDTYRRGNEVLKCHADMLKVSGWGSSSMERMAPQFTDLVHTLDPSASFYSGGKGGEWSTHIAARLGSVPFEVSIANGTIPAEGPIVVEVSNARPSSSMRSFTGSLNGVVGTMSSTGSAFTFTRTTSGSEVALAPGTRFIPEVGPQYRDGVTLLWMGKNDAPIESAESIVARTDASYDYLTPMFSRCLVLGHFHDSNTLPTSLEAQILDKVNDAHRARYGVLFVDVQAYLMSNRIWTDTGIAPTAADLAQQAFGQKPTSLSVDNGHMNNAAYTALSKNIIEPLIRQLGWY